jgi:Leucine-rich repeat (LRR) protein
MLTSLPESIGKLQNLEYLDLKDNQITSLPESISNLQKLYTLNLSGNANLTNLPESIVNFSEEIEIDIQGTGITTLPANLPGNIIIVGMEQILVNSFESDIDCEGEDDPVSLELIPKGRGFLLDADQKCYDANTIRQLMKNESPLTRAPFTEKDLQRKRSIPLFQGGKRTKKLKKSRKTKKVRKSKKAKKSKKTKKVRKSRRRS